MALTRIPYPYRYYTARPDARALAKQLDDHVEKKKSLDPSKAMALAGPQLTSVLSAAGWSHTGPVGSLATFSQEMQGLLMWSQWFIAGRKSYALTPKLTEALRHSDCGEMRISDVAIPASCFYIDFGPQGEESFQYGDGEHSFEGAYVHYAPGTALRVVLCGATKGASAGRPGNWRERYDLRILAERFNASADDAIDLALADDLADLRLARASVSGEPINSSEHSLTALKEQASRDLRAAEKRPAGPFDLAVLPELRPSAPPPSPLANARVAEIDLLTKRMLDDHAAFRSGLLLVLNALAYLEAIPADSREVWPDNTPERMLSQVNRPGKDGARARSKLWALGFGPVKLVGEAFNKWLANAEAQLGAGVRTHWRKGHWRRQAHGPSLSLRKLAWIYPTLVAGGERES